MSMRSAGRRLARKFERAASKGELNSGPVIIRWRSCANAGGFDPILDGSSSDHEWEDMQETVQAFIHAVSIHTTGYTRFAEIQTGDVILDFPRAVNFSGKNSVEFEIDGVLYVQKNGGKELARSWDVRCNGLAVTQTILVTPKS